MKTWNNNKNITDDSRVCQQKCKSTAKCKYWSFEKKGNGRCYLKTKKERCQIYISFNESESLLLSQFTLTHPSPTVKCILYIMIFFSFNAFQKNGEPKFEDILGKVKKGNNKNFVSGSKTCQHVRNTVLKRRFLNHFEHCHLVFYYIFIQGESKKSVVSNHGNCNFLANGCFVGQNSRKETPLKIKFYYQDIINLPVKTFSKAWKWHRFYF